MNIAICEDNKESIVLLKDHISRFDTKNVNVDVYDNGESLIDKYSVSSHIYDVVFMDMEMGNMNGIETANIIREYDDHVIIVFVTSHTKYMRESFQCLPFRYLLKPVSYEEFEDVFSKICAKLSKERKTISFNENKKLVRLYCDDIIYCESEGHYTWIYTKADKYKVCKSLSDIYKQVDFDLLHRVDKSYVVNFSCVQSVAENNNQLNNTRQLIPISRSYKKDFLKKFTNFIEREMSL